MPPLSRRDIKACEHPRLPLRFALSIICVLLLLPVMLIVSFFGIISMILVWIILLVWLAREVLYAHFVSNTILVTELNYPRILNLSNETKDILGVRRKFSVFVYEHGAFNAYMMRMFFRRAVFLNSEILETGVSDDEVRWIVGRFVGYWRVQQDTGVFGWAIRMTQQAGILNLFMLPYERAMVYTGDRLGTAAIDGDISSSISAMQKLLVGRLLGYSVNPVGVVDQARRVKGSIFAFLARLPSAFPHTITRYVDLMAFASRRYPEQFAVFEAANPGLPRDFDELSGERTSGGSMLKMFGAIVVVWLALVVSILVGAGALRLLILRMAPAFDRLASASSTTTADSSSPPALTPPSADTTPAPAAESAAPPAPGPTALDDPVIKSGVSYADLMAAYPQRAKDAGVTGDVTVQCVVTPGGGMSDCHAAAESPTGYGFGDVAVMLASQITVELQGKDGSAAAGRTVAWDIPFKPQQ